MKKCDSQCVYSPNHFSFHAVSLTADDIFATRITFVMCITKNKYENCESNIDVHYRHPTRILATAMTIYQAATLI